MEKIARNQRVFGDGLGASSSKTWITALDALESNYAVLKFTHFGGIKQYKFTFYGDFEGFTPPFSALVWVGLKKMTPVVDSMRGLWDPYPGSGYFFVKSSAGNLADRRIVTKTELSSCLSSDEWAVLGGEVVLLGHFCYEENLEASTP